MTSEAPVQSRASRRPFWLMLVTGMSITLVVMVFGRLAYGFILPFMRRDLGLSYAEAGNLGTANALGYLCLVMIAGLFASRRGGRAAVLVGLAMTTIGFIGMALAAEYRLMLLFMLLLGCGTAFAFTPVIALLGGSFPERRGAVVGISTSGIGIGLALMGFATPTIAQMPDDTGWRAAWAVFAVMSALAMAATFAFLRNPPGQGPRAVAATGSRPGKMAVYRNPQVLTVGVLYGVLGVTYIAQAIFMFSFALDSGVSSEKAGRLGALSGILSVFAGPTWGWLSDRFDRATVLTAGVTGSLLGTLIPVVWPNQLGFTLYYVITGCTYAGMFTSVIVLSSAQVAPQHAPLALSFVTVFFAVGQFVGPAFAGILIDQLGGFRPAFLVSCVVLSLGVYLSWRLRRFGAPPAAAATAR